ncbi:hypothetical protein [Bordetella flabilis]|uniref:Uncharacterized protein n=1 Tax=Bordetella flabilis TaxID=463014 RepID=A0A193GL87_9BORD|nr:hypothetical protein [Bordetella flabilis]ANN80857.1 hypothetical protein BAU07_26410 [Bordetella flabilis]
MELSEAVHLVPNQAYEFKIRDWRSPLGDLILGETKMRTFLGIELVGAVGMPKEPFIHVMSADGKDHLIAIETIEHFEVCHAIQ